METNLKNFSGIDISVREIPDDIKRLVWNHACDTTAVQDMELMVACKIAIESGRSFESIRDIIREANPETYKACVKKLSRMSIRLVK